ncbi:hypothetical protein C1751_01490 [Pseudomonas fluorescens]|nr:hypothetical protein C1751_01490 [Pseudomonas fluorescens]
MCNKYGWPLSGQCGGSFSQNGFGADYWSSSPSPVEYFSVYLETGAVIDNSGQYRLQVTCVQR